MRSKAILVFGAAFLGIFVAAPSFGMQLGYEPFNIGASPTAGEYAVGPLAGQNTTNSLFSGPWSDRDVASANDTAQATGLSYLGAPSSGGSILLSPDSSPVRSLSTTLDATTVGTYFLGFQVNFGVGDYTTTAMPHDILGYRAMELRGADGSFQMNVSYNGYNGSLNDNGVNQDPNTGRMLMEVNGTGLHIIQNSPDSFRTDNGATHLVVLKFVLSATAASDSISLYLDPTDATEPVIPGATVSGVDFTLGQIGGAMFGGVGTFPTLDEFRLATTFAEAVPVFPIPGDTNGDMLVNQADYLNILHATNLTGTAIPNSPTDHPDVNGDGKVTIADYRIWKDHRTDIPSGTGAGAAGNVPEPTTLALAMIASLAILSSARVGLPFSRPA